MQRAASALFLVALFYWLMVGFRFQVGMDWNNYLRIYDQTQLLGTEDIFFGREPGFAVLNWLAGEVGGGPVFVNAVAALVFCWGFFHVAKRCREPFLAVVVATPLLVVGFAMSGTRQGIALGIIYYLFATWENRRILSRMALVLLASLFHFSAVFALIFVALSTQTSIVVRSAGALIVGVIILLIIYFAPASMEIYTETYAGARKLTAPGAIVQVGILAAAALVYFGYRKTWIVVNGDNPLYRDLAMASIAALLFVAISSVAAYRFALYFWPMGMYVWGGVPAIIRSGVARALYRFTLVTLSVVMLVGWLSFANNSGAWLPYGNWLLQPQDVDLFRQKYSD